MASGAPGENFTPAAWDALKAFPVDPVDLKLVALSENVTFRVTDRRDGRAYVLRLHRPGYHSQAELDSEPMWTRALNQAGIPAPVALSAHDGRHYVPVSVAAIGEQRLAGMAHWTEGELLSDVLDRTKDMAAVAGYFRQLGGMVAAMHNQASGWRPPVGFTRHVLDVDGLMGEAPFWGPFWDHPAFSPTEHRLLKDTRDQVRTVLEVYGTAPGMFSLIHADLHPGNILVGEAGLTVIDFDDAAFGWHVYDIAVALSRYETDARFAAMQAAFLTGYVEARALAERERSMIPTFLMIRRMALIGWLRQRPEIDASSYIEEARRIVCNRCAAFEPPL